MRNPTHREAVQLSHNCRSRSAINSGVNHMHVRYLVPEGADLDDGLGVDLFKPGGDSRDRGALYFGARSRDGRGLARSWEMNQLADCSAGKMCDLAGDLAKYSGEVFMRQNQMAVLARIWNRCRGDPCRAGQGLAGAHFPGRDEVLADDAGVFSGDRHDGDLGGLFRALTMACALALSSAQWCKSYAW